MSSKNIYCVYLTTYTGNKMPNFYIGSSSVKKVQDGYKGSPRSKEYKRIWVIETKNSPHLFKTRIIYTCESREEATIKENKLHHLLDVVRNPLYINMWYAIPNGFKGYNCKGKNNPMYGKRNESASKRMLENNPMTDRSVREKVSNSLKGRAAHNKGKKNPEQSERLKQNNPMMNKESIKKMLAKRKPEHSGKGFIWVANKITKERTRIHPSSLQEKVEEGWIKLSNKSPIPD